MAKILFGAIVADARKKIAGNVFSKSRFGSYIRKKSSPVQPRTDFQRAVRANFSANSKNFSTVLTSAEILAWNTFATTHPVKDRFGNTQNLTGLQWYQKLNRELHTIAQTAITAPPASISTSDLGGVTLTQAAVTPFHISVATTNLPATGEYIVIIAAPPLPPGRSFIGKKFRIILVDIGTTVQPIDISPAYTTKWGPQLLGQKINVQVYNVVALTGGRGTAYQDGLVLTSTPI